jgi:glyoxylate reductase
VLTEDTADMTMALILAVPRRLAEGERLMRSGNWSGLVPDLRCSATASGASGSASSAWAASARRWRGARAASASPIHYHNRRRVAPDVEQKLEATYWESLDQMLARMDIVSVNCPHTPATYHLLSARRLEAAGRRPISSTPRAAR